MSNQIPPGPDGGFLGLNNILRLKTDALGFLVEIAKAYGNIIYFQIGNQSIYLLNHPDLIRQVLNDLKQFNKSALTKASNCGYFGDGLTTLEGDNWKARRHLMQPAFHPQYIVWYIETIVECVQDMVNHWQSGDSINIDKTMRVLTARIAARIFFDAELEGYGSIHQNKKRTGIIPLKEAMGEEFTVTQNSGISDVFQMTRLRAAQNMETTLKIIQRRFASQEDRGDMLSFLLTATYPDGSQMKHEDIIGELLQMFFAGHHSIPATLMSLWQVLLQYPEIETKIHEELKLILGGKTPGKDDLAHLVYSEMVIKETMRFYPLPNNINREIVDDIKMGGYTLKKGGTIWIIPYVLHHNPHYFEQPDLFLPERFNKDNANKISSYSYFPFGAGPRICIAHQLSMMIVQLILAIVAQSYYLREQFPEQSFIGHDFLTSGLLPNKDTYMRVIAR